MVPGRMIAPILAGLLLAPPLRAADAESTTSAPSDHPTSRNPSSGLEEIIVAARRRPESVQLAPVSVSAFRGSELEASKIERLDDLSLVTPSLSVTQTPAFASSVVVALRGISDPDTILTNDSPIAIYVDGVYIARSIGALLDLSDLDRVEVLRGPQGTMFGRNTTGGAISLYTRPAAQTFGITQTTSYASGNEFIARTAIDTGTLGKSDFAAKIDYLHHQLDGYARNLLAAADSGPGAIRRDAVFAAVSGSLAEDLTLEYAFDYAADRDQPVNTQVVGGYPFVLDYFEKSASLGGAPFMFEPNRQGTIVATGSDPARLKMSGNRLTLSHNADETLQIKSITSYRSLRESASVNLGGIGALKGLVLNPLTLTASVQPVFFYDSPRDDEAQDQWSEEVQITGHLDTIHYVAGLYAFDEHVAEASNGQRFTYVLPPGTLGPGAPTIGENLTTSLDYRGQSASYATYGEVSYSPPILSRQLELDGGLRYNEDIKQLNQNDSTALRNLEKTFDDLSATFSAKYQWDPRTMSYIRIARAYKAGGFNPRDSGEGYAPERAMSYEAGVKTELLDRHLQLNADTYLTDYKNLQISEFVPGTQGAVTQVVNAGEATYTGAEIEAAFVPAIGWLIDAEGGYVDPEYQKYLFVEPSTGAVINIARTARFVYASRATCSLGARYEFPSSSTGDLTIQARWAYQGARYFDYYDPISPQAQNLRAAGWNNVDVALNLASIPAGNFPGAIGVRLYGNNLLNDYQRIQGIDFGPRLGFGVVSYGRGRVIGADVTITFR